MREERMKLRDALQIAGVPALQHAYKHGQGIYVELENRIKGVVEACVDLQRRSLDWTPGLNEAYAFSGDPPYDLDEAKKKKAQE